MKTNVARTALAKQVDSRSHWSLLAVVLALLAIYSPLFAEHRVIGGMDFLNLIFPQSDYARKVVTGGTIPLWNWFTWGGTPLLAAWQSAILYPPTWLAWGIGLPYGLHITIFLHLVWAALGTWQFAALVFGATSWGGALAGVVYAGSGFYLGHIEQVNSVAALSWTPWLAYALGRFFVSGRGGWLIACGTGAALLAGHPQHVELALLFSEIWLALLLVAKLATVRPSSYCKDPMFRRFFLTQGFVMIGIAVAAVQVLPALELTSLSERVWPYATPFEPSLRWQHTIALVWPRFYNRLAETAGQPIGFTELGLYIGGAAFLLSCYGIYGSVRSRRTSALACLGAAAMAWLYALGPEGGVASIVNKLVPLFQHQRASARALNFFVLSLACCAGAGLDAVLQARTPRLRSLLALSCLVIVAADLAWTHRPELESLFVPNEVLHLAAPLDAPVAAQPGSPNRVYRFMAHDSDFFLDHRASAVAERFLRQQPNLNMLWEKPLTDGYEEGLLPAWRYANFLRRFNRNLRNDELDAPLLALMGVNTVLTEYPVSFAKAGWTLVAQTTSRAAGSFGARYTLWRSPYPTAWFFDAGSLFPECHDAETLQRKLEAGYFASDGSSSQPRRIAPSQLEQEHPLRGTSPQIFALAKTRSGITNVRVYPNKLGFLVCSSAPSLLVYSGTLSPGWKLRVGGETAVRVGRESALGPFWFIELPRSGRVGARSGTIAELFYDPWSFRFGSFLSLLTVGGFAAVAGRPWRRKAVEG